MDYSNAKQYETSNHAPPNGTGVVNVLIKLYNGVKTEGFQSGDLKEFDLSTMFDPNAPKNGTLNFWATHSDQHASLPYLRDVVQQDLEKKKADPDLVFKVVSVLNEEFGNVANHWSHDVERTEQNFVKYTLNGTPGSYEVQLIFRNYATVENAAKLVYSRNKSMSAEVTFDNKPESEGLETHLELTPEEKGKIKAQKKEEITADFLSQKEANEWDNIWGGSRGIGCTMTSYLLGDNGTYRATIEPTA